MKTSIFLVVFFTCLNSFGQNWNLLVSNKTYFYQHTDSTFISNVVHVDSLDISGLDTSYHLNRKIIKCDTCTVIPNNSNDGFLYHGYAKEFFGYTVDFDNTNDYYLVDGGIIKHNAQLAGNWLFSTGITATIISVGEESIMGNTDSVKTIELTGGDTIKISKNNGVIRYPDLSNPPEFYELVGYHENQLSFGEYLPNFWRTYDFSVNDKFSYYLESWIIDNKTLYKITLEILEDLSTSTKKEFVVRMLGTVNYENGWSSQPIFTSSTVNLLDTISLEYSPNALEELYSGISTFYHSDNEDMTLYPHLFTNNFFAPSTQFGSPEIQVGTQGYYGQFGNSKETQQYVGIGDSLFYITNWFNYNSFFSNEFGRTQQIWFDFEWLGDHRLEGAIVDGDTTGNVYHFNEDIGFNNYENALSFYPNPAKDFIKFQGNFDQIQIFSIEGKLIRSINQPNGLLNIQDLNSGLYILQGKNTIGEVYVGKLIVQ